jgi:acyl-CoA synthetase (AMP-forming)/AMP-acid ligase II
MKVASAALEKVEMTIEDLPVGSHLIPMSAFKQVGKTSVFAIPDDYINLKNFLWVSERKDANGKEFTAFYCKESFSKELVAKIEEDDVEALEKFLEDSMVSLEDYNKFNDKTTEGK